MTTTRRDFLQRSVTASAAAALSAGPLAASASAAERMAREDDAANAAVDTPATIKAFERRMFRAKPVALSKVRVTGGPLQHAQEITGKYLLSLNPDRMMAYYRMRAGLSKKAEPYTGWDGAGKNLTGHIAGHHLSGVSYMYAATGDVKFKERADYLVRELKEVQDKHGDGYLSALENGREKFAEVSKGDIRSGGFDLNGLWSPWYVLHKTFAGLRDSYRLTGNPVALTLGTKFAGWAERAMAPLDEDQWARMLNTEHGGMNEVLADLYADTGDKRWLTLSYKFEHKDFTDALKRHQDNLSGKHGNCQIPKIMGSAKRYGYTADTSDIVAAAFFFDRVAQHHSYSTGGHGLSEYFGAPDQLSARVDGRTAETCNVYNMLKLSRRLFSYSPDPHYADFNERALFNHILASIDPEDARTSYMVPVGRGVTQEYQDMQRSFTCCVGSGMESHALHGDGVYYESDDKLWVNLFVPSTVQFTMGGVKLTQETSFPDGDQAKLSLAMAAPKTFTLAVRRPVWAGDAFKISVNGTAVPQPELTALYNAAAGGRNGAPGNEAANAQPSSYVEIKRLWKTGDVVELSIPKTVSLEPTADNKQVASVMWGPLVLAGDLGPGRGERGAGGGAPTPRPQIPVLVAADRPIAEWVKPDPARAGNFSAHQVARFDAQQGVSADVSLTPFYRTHRRTYSVYFDVLTPKDFAERGASMAAERARVAKMEASTVALVQPGEMQPERDYNYVSEPADRPTVRTNGRANRGGAGWFSFDIPVDPSAPMMLAVTYMNELGLSAANGDFEILVDGTSIAKFVPNPKPGSFYDAQYSVPASLVAGKTKVTVKFQASVRGRIAPVFGVRMYRAN
ncbi:MAG: beta-L-arabinofuranosidase domain-containing protein [Gemmatimonas sp.]